MESLDNTIEAILAGDADRFAEIVDAYEEKVRMVIAAMIPDKNQIADITQETFIIVYNKLNTYRPGTNFVAWLRTIARNTAQNERRRWYRRRDMQDNYRVEVEQTIEQEIEGLLDELPEDIVEALQGCKGHLNEKTRKLVEGYYFDELSIKDLANMFKLKLSNAKVSLHRARQAIGNCMRDKGHCEIQPDE